MKKILLLGEQHTILLPGWSEREELAFAYADLVNRLDQDSNTHPQLLRMYAAAIGICSDRIKRRSLEAGIDYLKLGCNPLEYGGKVYNFLCENSKDHRALKAEIVEAGLQCLSLVGEALAPRRSEIETSANFTSPNEASPTP